MFLRKLLKWSLSVVLVLAVVAGAAFFWLRASGRAQREGTSRLPGLAAAVDVRWDRWAIPYVSARSSSDAFAAIGWLHANDRMFQMELARRAAAGRLSELFGERALEFDRKVRRLGIRRAAERLVESASDESRRALTAYASGVNAWLTSRDGDLPPELRLLRVHPEPWSAADSISIVFMMARQLSAIFEPNEEELFVLLRAFGPDRARDLAGDADATIFDEVVRAAAETPAAGETIEAVDEAAGLGSNNWAVGAARSADGKPLVANDPHLGLGLPGVWYQASIRSPEYDASGMTIPGVPGIVLGRSENVAWACTNLYVDDVDVFLERVDATNSKVLRGTEWVPIQVEEETIRIKGGEEVKVKVRSTDRGPLLEPDPVQGLPARSVAWSGFEKADQLLAFLRLAQAKSVEEVPAAIATYVFPAQNLVAADRQGKILWTPIGSAPNRFGWDGRFPAPAERLDLGWNGMLPASDNPVLIDPPDGAIVTANSFLPVPQPVWFQGEFDTPYRADRIRELLLGRNDWTPGELTKLEGDTTSLWAKWLVGQLDGHYEGDAARAHDALAKWDGAMSPAGPAALFALVEREIYRAVFEDEARDKHIGRFGTRWRLQRLLSAPAGSAPGFFDDVSTPAVESREATLGKALAAAWKRGAMAWGENVATWPYARIHQLLLDHPLGSLPLAGRLLNRGPFELPGSATTVLAFGGPWQGGKIDVSYGPSMRLVNDLADPDKGVAIVPGGQAGHFADPHYADQLPLYLQGESHPVPWSEGAIRGATVATLQLLPEGGKP